MAVYKVLQDVEAEDKLVAFLGIRQFIYAGVVAILGFISFRILVAGGPGYLKAVLIIMLLLPMLVFGVLASPLGGSQSTEIWVLSRLQFFFKPQRRIWDQDGPKQLVTITAPKRPESFKHDNLSQDEVRSRLNALASTMDSRGWAVKSASVNQFTQPGYLQTNNISDRLVNIDALPQEVPAVAVHPEDDIMDPYGSSTAQHVDQLLNQQVIHKKEQLQQKMQEAVQQNSGSQPADFWFMHQVDPPTTSGTPADPLATFEDTTVNPIMAAAAEDPNRVSIYDDIADENELLDKIHKREKALSAHKVRAHGHEKVVLPEAERRKQAEEAARAAAEARQRQKILDEAQRNEQIQKAVTEKRQAAMMEIAKNSEGLSVATVAKQAKHRVEQTDDGEVVISLH